MSDLTHKGEFVEIKYSGFANGDLFDSNIEEDLKKLNPNSKVEKAVVAIGEGMVVPGLDKSLEGKEIGKEYEVSFTAKEGFGERDRNLMRTIPLSLFHEQKVDPKAGMLLTLDNALVKIVSVSSARVIADFNNPLAGKNLRYTFTIVRKIDDVKEKSETLFSVFFKFVPQYEIKEKSVVVKGPKNFEMFVNVYKEKFNELIKRDLEFQEISKEEFEKFMKVLQEKNHKHDHQHDQPNSHDHK